MASKFEKARILDRIANDNNLSPASRTALVRLEPDELLLLESELKKSNNKAFADGQEEAKMRQQMGPSQWPS